MRNDLIDVSIASGRLQLPLEKRITHYLPVSIGFIIPVIGIFILLQSYFKNEAIPYRIYNLWLYIIPIILACLIYWLQYRRLKFKIIETSLSTEETLHVFRIAIKNLNWKTKTNNTRVIVAKVNNGWLSGSWGEQVTIILDGNKIYINSICDPDKKSSVASYGNNRKNITSFLREIGQVAKERKSS